MIWLRYFVAFLIFIMLVFSLKKQSILKFKKILDYSIMRTNYFDCGNSVYNHIYLD